jgi:ATP-binding cassette subfamily A (ABC1) protein 3
LIESDENYDAFEMQQMPENNYEAPPVICKRLESSGEYLRISNLHKTFSGGFRAVNGLNVKMYDSQIFALLGHNGAGKTTTISMLTGLIKKSQG